MQKKLATREPLAVHGGSRAITAALPVWPPNDPAIEGALTTALADGSWGKYHGPHVQRLADRLVVTHGVEFALTCCSGTFAVELALRALKIGPGDEVILAGYDFAGNFRAIEAVGARPVLVDVLPGDWVIDPVQLAAAIEPETRAVIVSHLHGSLVNMPLVMELAALRNIVVVEDACQATGALVAGQIAGSWGDVGVLSFGGSKLLTAGRGGALLTPHAEVAQRAKIYCHRGNDAFPLSELQAAVLLPQLSSLPGQNTRRAVAVTKLLKQLKHVEALRRPEGEPVPLSAGAYYKLAWYYHPEAVADTPIDDFVAALQAEGAPIDRGFRGFSGRSDNRCRKLGTLEESRNAAEATLTLHHPILLGSDELLDQLAAAVHKVAQGLSPGKDRVA